MAKQDNQFTAEELAAKDEAEKQQAIKDMTVKGKVKAVTPAEEVATVPVTDNNITQDKYADRYKQADELARQYNPQPIYDEYNVSAPVYNDYIKDTDWFDTYFPTVSKEDEQQRQKKYEQAQRWGLFGNALAAIGNAVGATYGGRPVQIYEPKAPDLQAWKNQLNTDRRARAAAEHQQMQQYTSARNTWQTAKNAHDNQVARDKNAWLQQLNTSRRNIYNTLTAADAREDKFANQKELEDKKQQDRLEVIDARGNKQMQVQAAPKSKAGGGASSSGGGRSSSSKTSNATLSQSEVEAWDNMYNKLSINGQQKADQANSPKKRREFMGARGITTSSSKTSSSNSSKNGGKKSLGLGIGKSKK